MADAPQLPGFVFAGFPRTGSQFIQKCLQTHPEIDYRAKPRFFNVDKSYFRGPDYYRSLLAYGATDKLLGEGDEHYLSKEARFADPLVITERIHDLVPEAKILICIRSQVDFLLSGFRLWKRSGLTASFSCFMQGWPEQGVAFAEIADFYPYVAKYVSLFGEENVKVLLHEDLVDDQGAFLTSIFTFLGVSADCVSQVLAQVTYRDVNPAPSRTLSRVLDLTNTVRMKNPGLFRWIFPVRLYKVLTAIEYRLLGSSAHDFRSVLSAEEIEMIRQRYAPGNIELSQLLGSDLKTKGYPV